MKFVAETSERGVTERRFDLPCGHQHHEIPGVLWTPAGEAARALVLIGHGAGLEKRSPYILSLARRLVRHHGIAAAAIDGPEHGDRVRTGEMWWTEEITDATVADWKAVLAACLDLPEIGSGSGGGGVPGVGGSARVPGVGGSAQVPVGYWGFSMGTIFGLPFVASEPSLAVAVLGLMGLTGPTQERIERDAKSLRPDLPLLFVLQRDDELFPMRAGVALFDTFATTDKRLHVNLGGHSAVPVDEFEYTEAFLAKHLLA